MVKYTFAIVQGETPSSMLGQLQAAQEQGYELVSAYAVFYPPGSQFPGQSGLTQTLAGVTIHFGVMRRDASLEN